MPAKHPIHITLSTEGYKQELLGMDKLRFKEKVDTQSISRIIKRAKIGIFWFDGHTRVIHCFLNRYAGFYLKG